MNGLPPSPAADDGPRKRPTHTATSLTQTLSRNRTLKGVPPPSIIANGVACLSATDMQRLHLHATDPILLTHTTRTAAAIAWPLATVSPSTISLDDATLATLALPPAPLPPPPMGTPTKKKKPKRRGTPSPTPNRPTPATRTEPSPTVHITALPHPTQIPTARAIHLCPQSAAPAPLAAEEFAAMVHAALQGRLLLPGTIVPVSLLGTPILLVVARITPDTPHTAHPVYARVAPSTALRIVPPADAEPSPTPAPLFNSVAGLRAQARELTDLAHLALEGTEPRTRAPAATGDRPLPAVTHAPRGALLHGPPGTGKTLLACAVGEAVGAKTELICAPAVLGGFAGEAVRALEGLFARARRKRPCVVVLDEVDAIAPRRDAPDSDDVQRKLTAALLAILDGHDASLDGLFVVGTTNRPDAIDAAMRRAGRFDREIEVTVPDSKARLEILELLSAKAGKEDKLAATDEELKRIADICYGFVGADLSALWRESVVMALRRSPTARVTYDDMRCALKLVKPSALREVAVEIPSTRWSDIGGKADPKQRLKEAVEWPLTARGAALFASIGVSPPKGILLYGPPGCSKTLLARAVATESGANFISVKGAELLSKWVGESEKAVRGIFRRARQAAPCVVFFDEVDALAGARSASGGASAQARVVAQLLAEMDGIDSTPTDPARRVVVIAATNRPDCLDDAFLRPGRIDAQIYVGLPDAEERLAILNVHARKVPLAENVDLACIAEDAVTKGFSGAEVSALVREAALVAMEHDVEGASVVSKADFDCALKRVRPRTPSKVVQYFDEYVKRLGGRSSGVMFR